MSGSRFKFKFIQRFNHQVLLFQMCSTELASVTSENAVNGVKQPPPQSTMLTPPWTPQYDRSYSPPKQEHGKTPSTAPATLSSQPPQGLNLTTSSSSATGTTTVVQTNKENLPNNMQSPAIKDSVFEKGMTYREYKAKQNAGKNAPGDHFKSLILSSETDVTTCGKMVVDRVIESIYSQEFGKKDEKTQMRPRLPTFPTDASRKARPEGMQSRERSGTMPSGRPHNAHGSTTVSPPRENQNGINPAPNQNGLMTNGKPTLTFGQIQETLIRKAVENSYEFDLASGLKSDSGPFDGQFESSSSKPSDLSVFDFPSSDVGQNLVEMNSFESRIKSSRKHEGVVPKTIAQGPPIQRLPYPNTTTSTSSAINSNLPMSDDAIARKTAIHSEFQNHITNSINHVTATRPSNLMTTPPGDQKVNQVTWNSAKDNADSKKGLGSMQSSLVPPKKRKFHLPPELLNDEPPQKPPSPSPKR